MDVVDRLVAGLHAAGGLVLPARCGGCAAPGQVWCHDCRGAARRPPPSTTPAVGTPACWAATRCEGPVRAAVTAHKDGGRRDLRAGLADLLAVAAARALAGDPGLRAAVRRGVPVLLVPVPESRRAGRRRGEDPVGALAAAAAAALDDESAVLVRALRHVRPVADQTGLGRAARAANLAGALAVAPRFADRVEGAACLVLDDVVTAGATRAEAAGARRAAGSVQVAAAVVAATPRSPRGPPGAS